jgi:hypothetical protein
MVSQKLSGEMGDLSHGGQDSPVDVEKFFWVFKSWRKGIFLRRVPAYLFDLYT